MSQQYNTVQDDVLDAICYTYYGRVDMLPQVLAANHGLAEQPERLPMGLTITLPTISKPDNPMQSVNLWD